MLWTGSDSRLSRRASCELVEPAEQGVVDWEMLARDLIGWMSEADVKQFVEQMDYLPVDD